MWPAVESDSISPTFRIWAESWHADWAAWCSGSLKPHAPARTPAGWQRAWCGRALTSGRRGHQRWCGLQEPIAAWWSELSARPRQGCWGASRGVIGLRVWQGRRPFEHDRCWLQSGPLGPDLAEFGRPTHGDCSDDVVASSSITWHCSVLVPGRCVRPAWVAQISPNLGRTWPIFFVDAGKAEFRLSSVVSGAIMVEPRRLRANFSSSSGQIWSFLGQCWWMPGQAWST